jgi:hypothetical protein
VFFGFGRTFTSTPNRVSWEDFSPALMEQELVARCTALLQGKHPGLLDASAREISKVRRVSSLASFCRETTDNKMVI